MNYFYFFLSGILGVCFNLFMKFTALQKDAKTANMELTFSQYLKNDLGSIMLSFISIGAWLLCFGEFAEKYPFLQNFARASFFCMGAIGTYIITFALSKTKKNIREVVDAKTNKADGITDKQSKDDV